MDLDYYMSLPYRVEIIKDTDEEWYVAFIPELKGCITTGTTEEEALENLKDAKAAWFSSAIEDGDPIPEPARDEVLGGGIPWMSSRYCGRVFLGVFPEEMMSMSNQREMRG